MVKPLGESKDVREFFPELAKRIGGGMEDAYDYGTLEDYMEHWAKNVPANEAGKSGLDRLKEEGVWEDQTREPFYEPFLKPLSDEEMAGAEVNKETGVIFKDGVGIGLMLDGKPIRGFKTPSRKFEINSLFVTKIGNNEDCSDMIAASGMTKTSNRPEQHKGNDVDIDSMPIWFQPTEHKNLADDELIMTSFKWNVHNHGRTMNLKWLAEIVHSNPAWINPITAQQHGLVDGDWIELTSYYSLSLKEDSPHLKRDDLEIVNGRQVVSRMRVPVVLMEGIHPKAIAMSNSCGHWQYTNVAQAKKDRAMGDKTLGSDPDKYRDSDWERNMWWEDQSGGDPAKWVPNTGNGWNQNKLLPISPDPITGQQAFHDTVVSFKKV